MDNASQRHSIGVNNDTKMAKNGQKLDFSQNGPEKLTPD